MEESSVYDSRKRVLTRTITEDVPLKIDDVTVGKHVSRTTQTYEVKGIKEVYAELKKQRDEVIRTLDKVNKILEDNKELTESKELEELRQQLEDIQKLKGKVQAESQQAHALEQLAEVEKQMKILKKAVGVHVKFK